MAKAGKSSDIIQDAILAEYNRRRKADPEMKPYQLWKLVEATGVSRSTIYAFIEGKTTLNTRHASSLMLALDLSVIPSRGK